MRKTRVVLSVVIVLAVSCVGQDSGFSSNPAKMPVELKEEQRPAMKTGIIVSRALQYLEDSQNPDGSWGDAASQYKATALSSIALKRLAAPGRHENSIQKAQVWLRQSQPQTDEDKLTVVMAIAEIYTHKHTPRLGDKGVGADDKSRIKNLLGGIRNSKDNVWFDLFSVSRLPMDVERPDWSGSDNPLKNKYLERKAELAPDTVDGYLELYLNTCAKRWSKGDTWSKHKTTLVNAATERQGKNGSFPTSESASDPSVTALQVLCFSLEDIVAHRYFDTTARKEAANK